jgi:hypothetical protein
VACVEACGGGGGAAVHVLELAGRFAHTHTSTLVGFYVLVLTSCRVSGVCLSLSLRARVQKKQKVYSRDKKHRKECQNKHLGFYASSLSTHITCNRNIAALVPSMLKND